MGRIRCERICQICQVKFVAGRYDAQFCPEHRQLGTNRNFWRVQGREKRLSQRHGTSWNDLISSLLVSQNNLCYLCGKTLTVVFSDTSGLFELGLTHLDHDHVCCPKDRSCAKCRRGLCCASCNLAIGHAHDSPAKIRKIAYSFLFYGNEAQYYLGPLTSTPPRRVETNKPIFYESLWEGQQGSCYLCSESLEGVTACIDHDHRCCPKMHICGQCCRGLTHFSCNLIIGHLNEDVQVMYRVADNLEAVIRRRK